MKKKRVPKVYYSIEPHKGCMDEVGDLQVFEHENVWGDEIFDLLDKWNVFYRKGDAQEALYNINQNLLSGKYKD